MSPWIQESAIGTLFAKLLQRATGALLLTSGIFSLLKSSAGSSIWPAASVTAISPTCADAPGLSSPEIRTVNMGVPSYSTKVEKEWSCT